MRVTVTTSFGDDMTKTQSLSLLKENLPSEAILKLQNLLCELDGESSVPTQQLLDASDEGQRFFLIEIEISYG